MIQRTSEGRARAKAEGKHLGRHAILTPYQQREVLARLGKGESTRSIAPSFAVSHQTILRIAMCANGTV